MNREIVIDDYKLVESPVGDSWKCLKCDFVVLPDRRGHRCWNRDEMYTEKPSLWDIIDKLKETIEEMEDDLQLASRERVQE